MSSVVLGAVLCTTSFAQDKNLHIYLAYGQSNMSGQATVTDADRQTNPRFLVLRAGNHSNQKVGEFYPAAPPMGHSQSKVGIVDFFGRKMIKELPDSIKVAVANVAIGGQSIDLFDKDRNKSYVQNAKNKGYEVSCNIMAISTAQEGDLRAALDILGKSPVDVIYIVDSFGAMYPEQMQRLAALYVEYAEKYGKKIGIHAHNNQQLAFANTIEAVGDGVDWLDATYSSMGRGAGNCAMELLLGFLKNPKYNVFPVIKFIDEHMTKMREQGIVWGYDLQYLMTGLLNQHPRTAIAFTKENRNDYAEFYKEIVTMD